MIPPLSSRPTLAVSTGTNTYTGRGSPNGTPLVADLVASNISTALTISKARTAARSQAHVLARKTSLIPKRLVTPSRSVSEALSRVALRKNVLEVIPR